MAYTNVQSGEIAEGAQYYSGKLPLGDYNFYLSIDATGVSPKIVAKCVSPDGETRTAASRTWPAGTQVRGWSVEANETEASVYCKISKSGLIPNVFVGSELARIVEPDATYIWWLAGNGDGAYSPGIITAAGLTGAFTVGETYTAVSTYTLESIYPSAHLWGPRYGAERYVHDGVTYYYHFDGVNVGQSGYASVKAAADAIIPAALIHDGAEDVLIARFAINLGDAGGYPGGDGGWTSPGDWNSDPTTTLHLTVNGALSGRHNDPLEDPSYSYLPADNTAAAGYGCGGDGGHGGGGGAGASTVIVRHFATNKANYKDILALAKRHGYGSGGGKGGKGGDGCILIYY